MISVFLSFVYQSWQEMIKDWPWVKLLTNQQQWLTSWLLADATKLIPCFVWQATLPWLSSTLHKKVFDRLYDEVLLEAQQKLEPSTKI